MSQRRLDYLDMAKGIGIFFVVLGHIEFIQENTLRWIFSFHMPLFFVIGGMLSFIKREDERSAKEILLKKARGILIPYLSFSLILLTMAATGYFLQPGSVTVEGLSRQLVDSVTGYGLHILWFLPAYFLASSGFVLLSKYQKPGIRNGIVLGWAVLALYLSRYWGLDQYVTMEYTLWEFAVWDFVIVLLRALLAGPFVLLGWYLACWLPKIPGNIQKGLSLLWIPGSLLALGTEVFDLHYLHVEPLHYLTAVLSCTGLLCLMKSLPGSRVLSYLGRNSLVIMCTHASLYVIYYVSLGMFFVKKFIPMTDPVFNLAVAVLVCVAEVPVIWIFDRYFKHLLGRNVCES